MVTNKYLDTEESFRVFATNRGHILTKRRKKRKERRRRPCFILQHCGIFTPFESLINNRVPFTTSAVCFHFKKDYLPYLLQIIMQHLSIIAESHPLGTKLQPCINCILCWNIFN